MSIEGMLSHKGHRSKLETAVMRMRGLRWGDVQAFQYDFLERCVPAGHREREKRLRRVMRWRLRGGRNPD